MNNLDEFEQLGSLFEDSYDTTNVLELESESPGIHRLITEVTSRDSFPLFYAYINKEENITKENFFKYVLDNFNDINDNEFNLLNKNFFVRDYIYIMFEHVLDNNILIDSDTFREYLHSNKKHFNHFKKDYQQQLTTYYAFNHFDKIDNNDWSLIFEPVYEHEYRHLFSTISFTPTKPILNKTFWSFFSPKSNIVQSYLQHITTHNLHKSMDFMCEHFSENVFTYLYGSISKTESRDNTILEKHYIYHNPEHCGVSKLEYEDLKQVFARIYQGIPDKNLSSKVNKEFYDSLGKGIYYLFDYIAEKEPENLRAFFEKRPKVLCYLLEDLQNVSHKILSSQFQDNFFNHVFSKNLDLLYQHSDTVKQIITEDVQATPINRFLKDNIELLGSEDKQHIIFNVTKNNVIKFNMPLLIEQLMVFSVDSLQEFSKNINIYLKIINDSCECHQHFQEIQQSFNKSIINKQLTSRFNSDTHNKIKRSKI